MRFFGAVPEEVIEQTFRIHDLSTVRDAYVCCSGSFRVDRALAERFPAMRVHSNDVSLISVALGRAARGDFLPFKFTGKLAWLEELAQRDEWTRLGCLGVAMNYRMLRGQNPYIEAHRDHMRGRAEHYVNVATTKVQVYVASMRLSSFFAGDFREHAVNGIEAGGVVFGYPPTERRGFEANYRLIDDNTEWEHPTYNMWDPKDMPRWLNALDAVGARYCVMTEYAVDGREPSAIFTKGRAKRCFTYSSFATKTSFRREKTTKAEPFGYKPVDVYALTDASQVRVVEVDAGKMNHIKDIYQLPGLIHTDGFMRYLVYLDGMLAGGFVYGSDKVKIGGDGVLPNNSIYLLSDFSISREARLAKLVAMLATSRDCVRLFDVRRLQRTKFIATTAFSKHPASMKYRGIFNLHSRRELDESWQRKIFVLNYISEVRGDDFQGIYSDWWRRWGVAATTRRKEAEGAEGSAP